MLEMVRVVRFETVSKTAISTVGLHTLKLAEGGGIEPHAFIKSPTVFKTALPPRGGTFQSSGFYQYNSGAE